jgi:hypothetical protein
MQSRAVGNRTRHLLGENLLAPCFGQRTKPAGEIHAGVTFAFGLTKGPNILSKRSYG